MKTRFKSSEIAHVWANKGAPEGKCPSSISFQGPMFFSYQTVIARIIEQGKKRAYVVDMASFSVTTSGHQYAVRSAIPDGFPIYHVHCGRRYQLLAFTPRQLRDYYLKDYRTPSKGHDSRYQHVRAQDVLQRNAALQSALEVCEFFGLACGNVRSEFQKHAPEADKARRIVEEYHIKRAARREFRERKQKEARITNAIARAEAIANGEGNLSLNDYFGTDDSLLESRPDLQEAIANARACLLACNIDAWRQGAIGSFTGIHNLPVMLRLDGDEMQTSKGARVPIGDAERTFRFCMAARQRGWHRNGEQHKVGMYDLDAVNEQGVVAGCHRVSWEEIERFANLMGWL